MIFKDSKKKRKKAKAGTKKDARKVLGEVRLGRRVSGGSSESARAHQGL